MHRGAPSSGISLWVREREYGPQAVVNSGAEARGTGGGRLGHKGEPTHPMDTNLSKLSRNRGSRVSAKEQPLSDAAQRSRRKFLRFFPAGFKDKKYLSWERGYKWAAHEQWQKDLNLRTLRGLIMEGDHAEIAARAVRIESRTNLLFSFEKMALRDAVKTEAGARAFATGLYRFLHEPGSVEAQFEAWCETLGALPRIQTRVLTWPVATVFGFIAQPTKHLFLKPNATRIAAREYGFDFRYLSKPNFATYESLQQFAAQLESDLADLEPHDKIDLQSFIWVMGSSEYD